MISTYVKEEKRYTQEEVIKILECPKEKAVARIQKLKEYRVLKKKKKNTIQKDLTDLTEEDDAFSDEIIGDKKHYYVFTFVGIIDIAGKVLLCFPKYIQGDKPSEKDFCQLIKVLEKYSNTKNQIIRIYNEHNDKSAVNILSVMLFLIQDYFDNGLYSNKKDTYEVNGSGEIIWDKTINETFALISNNRPYYMNLLTKTSINDDQDYFKRLHKCIITEISRDFKNALLLKIFQIPEIELTDEPRKDFGNDDYIICRIENELNRVFNTRKQLVLKAIFSYIKKGCGLNTTDSFSFLGTRNFENVWETICKKIFLNQLEKSLYDIVVKYYKKPLCPKYKSQQKLKDIIEKPLWTAANKTASETLKPDIVAIERKNEKSYFIILDAKYYNPVLDENKALENQPGIGDITKQFFYHLAYKDFIDEHDLVAKNCFVMPTEQDKDKAIPKGEVKLKMFEKLAPVKVRFLPVKLAYDHYLSGAPLDISVLNLIK